MPALYSNTLNARNESGWEKEKKNGKKVKGKNESEIEEMNEEKKMFRNEKSSHHAYTTFAN